VFFCGVGWNVVKVMWGCEWDLFLVVDCDGVLVYLMNIIIDGDY